MEAIVMMFIAFLSFMVEVVFVPLLSFMVSAVTVLLRILFGLLAMYPKFFLSLGLICGAGVLATIILTTYLPASANVAQQQTPITTPTVSAIRSTVTATAHISGPASAHGSATGTTSQDVNLRVAPGVNASILKVLKGGTVVVRLDERAQVDGGVWIKVRGEDIEGWINQKFLQ